MEIRTKPDEGRCLRKPIKGKQVTEARRAEVRAPRLRGGWGLKSSLKISFPTSMNLISEIKRND